jgi:hypothetical protein
MRRLCLIAGFLFILEGPLFGQPDINSFLPVIFRLDQYNISLVGGIASDLGKRKLYVGLTNSYDPHRLNLWVFDINTKGEIIGGPRKYVDHPDSLAPGSASRIDCVVPDSGRHKLYLGVSHPNCKAPLVVYNLDAGGEPIGRPVAYETKNPYPFCMDVAFHPSLAKCYVVGYGGSGVSVFDIGSDGFPVPSCSWQGAIGGYSVNVRKDGTKIYMGTYASRLVVAGLDSNGNIIGDTKYYDVKDGPLEYMKPAFCERAIYFKGAGNNLSYFLLDEKGGVSGEAHTIENFPVQAVSSINFSDRFIIAAPVSFPDAITGKQIISGFKVSVMSVNPDGGPGRVLYTSDYFSRNAPEIIGRGNACPIAVKHIGWGFLGNKIKGVSVRVALDSFTTASPAPAASSVVKLGPENTYMRFVVSLKQGMLYAAGKNTIYALSLTSQKKDVIGVPSPNLAGPILLDDAAGILYTATNEGTIEARRILPGGTLGSNREAIDVGVKPILCLASNSKTGSIYVIGGLAQHQSGSRKFVRVPAAGNTESAIVDPIRGRLYVGGSGFAGNLNLLVWNLKSDGQLSSEKPSQYADGCPDGKGKKFGEIRAIVLDVKRNKLYLGGQLANPAAGESGITVYDLNENGDPVGRPRFYASRSKAPFIWSLCLSPGSRYLYEGGVYPEIFAWPLDSKGEPAADPLKWEIAGGGKNIMAVSGDGQVLIGGHYNAVELIPLDRNARVISGLKAVLKTDAGDVDLGFLRPGIFSDWVNLDSSLRDRVGDSLLRCNLSGAQVKDAAITFEFAQSEDDGLKTLKSVSEQLCGNTAVCFVPRYGNDNPDLITEIRSNQQQHKRYLSWAEKVALKPDERPKQFIIPNGLVCVDTTRSSLEDGLKTLALLGHNTIQVWPWGIPASETHAFAAKYGFTRFAYSAYTPPSYFDYNREEVSDRVLGEWTDMLWNYVVRDMDARRDEVVFFPIADEPGWYYPYVVDDVKKKPEALAIFRNYLKGKGLTPVTLGKNSWDEIIPVRAGEVKTPGDRKLLFWTARFYAESASAGFAEATAALKRKFNNGLFTAVNLNNAPGIFFRPSPNEQIAGNRDRSENAAMGAPDWNDIGRKKAVSCIWTEDWFGDNYAQTWSFYGDLLRCAAREGGIEYGGYIVGIPSGLVPDGTRYKMMALAGHGAKIIEPYIFGPGYGFADGWAEREFFYSELAKAIRTLGRGERLMFPGRPRNGTVAILVPKASQVWDIDQKFKTYMAELEGLHSALAHQHYSVDFVDDFDVEDGLLKKYKYQVFYVTAPNLSTRAQNEIVGWVKEGGTVVLMPGACTRDQYNGPVFILDRICGAERREIERVPYLRPPWELFSRPEVSITIRDSRIYSGTVSTQYQTTNLPSDRGNVLASFSNGSAALVETIYGKGRTFIYGFWPGCTYLASADRSDRRRLPVGWSREMRLIATAPARIAGAVKSVDISVDGVEGCLLESEKGIAVVLLNWFGSDVGEVAVTVANPGTISSVESLECGKLKFDIVSGYLETRLPLKTVDVLMLYR